MKGGKIKLLSCLIVLSSILGCATGDQYSKIFDPANLKATSKKSLIEYSSQLGSIKTFSKTRFKIYGVCFAEKCPMDQYIFRFYRAYCKNNNGIINPKNFIDKKIKEANKKMKKEAKLMLNTEFKPIPEYYKKSLSNLPFVNVGDILSYLKFSYITGTPYKLPKLYCYIPSKKKIFFVEPHFNKYRCARINEFWIKCPYTIEILHTSEENLNYILNKIVKRKLNLKKREINDKIDTHKHTIAYTTEFKTPDGLKFQVFLYPESDIETPFTGPTLSLTGPVEIFLKVTNESNKEKSIDLSKLNVVEIIAGKPLPALKVKRGWRLFFYKWGNCKQGKPYYSFIIPPKGICKIKIQNLERIEYPTKYINEINRKKVVIYEGLETPIEKKISLYDVIREM